MNTSPCARIELTTLIVLGIGYTGRCKFNYHTYTIISTLYSRDYELFTIWNYWICLHDVRGI